MTPEEEVIYLRQENQTLRERVRVQQGMSEGLQKQTEFLKEQVQALQERLKKDSHNSHLPPSSDRFHRQPKSLRKSSGKKARGQPGHPGSTLMLSPVLDQVIVHPVEVC